MDDIRNERKRLILSTVIPLLLLFIAYLVKASEVFFGFSLSFLGVHPLKPEGLPGIVLSAILHGDFAHLYANTIPLLILGAAVFYYYKDYGLRIFLLSWVGSGALLWLFARDGVHIGASGLIYALAAFHLVSAILRRNTLLIAFALVVVFLYGSLIWGIFPAFDLQGNVSEEGHLMGLVAGALVAWFYRKADLPWIEEPEEEEEEPDEEGDDDAHGGDPKVISDSARPVRINYTIRK